MDNKFLLSYDYLEFRGRDNFICSSYQWFENEEDLKSFVFKMKEIHKNDTFTVNEAFEISNVKEINLE